MFWFVLTTWPLGQERGSEGKVALFHEKQRSARKRYGEERIGTLDREWISNIDGGFFGQRNQNAQL